MIIHASAFRPGWCHNDHCVRALGAITRDGLLHDLVLGEVDAMGGAAVLLNRLDNDVLCASYSPTALASHLPLR